MPLTADVLRLDEARRIALHAQGFADPRPSGRVDRRHLRRVLQRVGLVQVDSVNVLTRSHELPFLARLGPYPRPTLAAWLWGGGEVFEYWGHEASLLPVELQPLLRWRMHREEGHAWKGVVSFMRTHPRLAEDILRAVAERGPVTLGELDHLGDAVKRSKPRAGDMWNWTPAKKAVEWLFWQGQVAAVRNPATFERHYVLPDRVVPAALLAAPTPPIDEAQKQLLLLAARSHGVGTARDLADYHRLNIVRARGLLAELAADGALRRVEVEGWREPAYLHPDAVLPRWVRASALLSPFDSLVWERARTEALFGFRYRIEIYVPAAKRVHGYYVLPYLHRGALVARVDLKADRAAGALLVRGAFGEPGSDVDDVAAGLTERLHELAGFLDLAEVRIEPNGDLAPALARLSSG
ncbi:MAG TPA: crosslink repair DNA glycosylase YcaQ family protein [Acidimicrobiales bacterium]|nr:crosslink repair DNA glycosylase YcaQ family protein [Acidimicrobiales bacterium]